MAQDIMVTLQKLANENTAKTFKFNRDEAKTTRQWQERMSDTAHQREVKDLIKAGLNPVLSSGGSGAPAYGASSASGTADSAVNALGNVESSRTSAKAIKYSADQSLKAAQAAAAAQRYAADQQAAAQRYAADMNYKTQMDRPQGSPFAIVDRLTRPLQNAFGKEGANSFKSFIKNPKSILRNEYLDENGAFKNQKAVQNMKNGYSVLSDHGVYKVRQFLLGHGYAPTLNNVTAIVNFMAGSKNSLMDLTPLTTAKTSAYTASRIAKFSFWHR